MQNMWNCYSVAPLRSVSKSSVKWSFDQMSWERTCHSFILMGKVIKYWVEQIKYIWKRANILKRRGSGISSVGNLGLDYLWEQILALYSCIYVAANVQSIYTVVQWLLYNHVQDANKLWTYQVHQELLPTKCWTIYNWFFLVLLQNTAQAGFPRP